MSRFDCLDFYYLDLIVSTLLSRLDSLDLIVDTTIKTQLSRYDNVDTTHLDIAIQT